MILPHPTTTTSGPTIQPDYIVPPHHHPKDEVTACHDGVMSWDGYDDLPVAALPVEFPCDIERYTGIGCPVFTCSCTVLLFFSPATLDISWAFQTDFGSLVQALYGIEEGISRGLWADSSPQTQRGRSGVRTQAIRCWHHWYDGHRSRVASDSEAVFRYLLSMIQHDQYRPAIPIRQQGLLICIHPTTSICYTGIPEATHAVPSTTTTTYPPGFRTNLHYAYHQRAGHDTDMTTDPYLLMTLELYLHPRGIHLIEHTEGDVFMMGWDGEAPQPISLYEDSDFSGYTHGQQVPRPFRLALDEIPRSRSLTSVFTACATFDTLHSVPRGMGRSQRCSDSHRSGRVAHPPPIDRPFAGRRVSSVFWTTALPERLSFSYSHCLSFSPSDFGPSTQPSELMRDSEDSYGYSHCTRYDWAAGAIPSSLHQKISHSEDDLHLTGFTFDEVTLYRGGCTLHGATAQGQKVQIMHPTWRGSFVFQRLLSSGPPTDLGQMHLGTGIPETPDVMIVAPPSARPSQHVLLPHGPHSDFDLFGVSVIDTDDVTLYDACTDEMDMIGTGRILDVARTASFSFGYVWAFMLEIDDDDSVTLLLLMATYQRAATTLFHDMMHRDVEVYVDDMIVKSRDRVDHLVALQRFFERIRQFRLRLNPKKCTFGSQPTVWDDDCQCTFEKIKECLLSSPVLVPPTLGALCFCTCHIGHCHGMHAHEMVSATDRFDIQYVTQKSVKWSIVADHLASLLVSDDRPIDDDFPDEQFVS
ncbi:hypothetical protein CK203_115695 [Vitis vinifera]|uniref:Reverse transcriptase domain-containing protein n=1 Tax=Vitis vinifera TaxID=29760 RepID=A0A438BNV9_VITVI|nr:hypothetical protein CK203_115695 [Vitis vinifera]